MKLKLFLLSALLLNIFTAKGQYAGGQVGPAKSTKSVGSGANLVDVDLFTGIGSVSIPIYGYSIANLDLGISLNYNAKGVKVDELATSVGLGWHLGAGGMITRQVYGIEDEITTPAKFSIPSGYGGYQLYSNENDTLQGMLVPGSIDPNFPPSDTLHWPVYDDEEHDLFHVEFGGRSLDFAFEGNGSSLTYMTYPKSEVKIEVFSYDRDIVNHVYVNKRNGVVKNIGLDTVHNILGFVITDESGNKFEFERGDYRERKLDLPTNGTFVNSSPSYYPVENWVLSKITTNSGIEIKYSYSKKYVDYVEDVSETLADISAVHDPEPLKIVKDEWKGYKTHISKIEYPNGVVATFDLDTSITARCDCNKNFRLVYISLESKVDNNYKNKLRFRMNHAYFNTPKYGVSSTEIAGTTTCSTIQSGLNLTPYSWLDSTKKDSLKALHLERGLRLKLKSISRMGLDNSTSEVYYSFNYNSTPLPYRFGTQKDYYGYYNGSTTDTAFLWHRDDFTTVDTIYTSIPYHLWTLGYNQNDNGGPYASLPYQIGAGWGANRSYNFTNAQASILTSVSNGSGGKDSLVYSNFTLSNPACSYGDHTFMNIGCSIDADLQGETDNDGLVVGKVISTDRFSVQNITTTEYTYLGGQRFFRGGYFDYPNLYGPSRNYTNFFTDPHEEFRGSNHGFDTVVVITSGYNNERLSKSLHTFSNLMYQDENGIASNLQKLSYYSVHTARATFKKFRMGLPLVVQTYDESDLLISKREYSYSDVITLPYDIQNFSRIIDHLNLPGAKPGGPGGTLPPIPPTGGCCFVCWASFNYFLLDYEYVRQTGDATTNYVYDGGTKTLVTSESYTHNSNDRLKSVTWQDSKGDYYRKWFKYNNDFSTTSYITALNQDDRQHLLSTEIWKMLPSTPAFTDSLLISMELSAPYYANDILLLPSVFTAQMSEPISSAQANDTTYINRENAFNYSFETKFGKNLAKSSQVSFFDSKGHALETYFVNKDVYQTEIWDTHFDQRIARVTNARYEDVAYTSFEGIYESPPTADYNRGNWDFDPDPGYKVFCSSSAPVTTAYTGKYVYTLEPDDNYIKSRPLNAIPYILSFWIYNPTTNTNLSVELFNGSSSAGTLPVTTYNTVGSWTFCSTKFTPTSGDQVQIMNISGVSVTNPLFIDEVRLYPEEASMITNTYKPLLGGGSACNANNQVVHLEYDVQGRPTIARDGYGNILTKTEIAIDNSDPNTSSSPNPNF